MTQLVALMEADMMGKRVDLVFEAYSGVAGAMTPAMWCRLP